MTRRYQSPKAFKTAVEHRLRRRAAEMGRDFQRERQLFVFDRMLHRIVETFGNNMILKGGLLLELFLDTARTTKDIDIGVHGDPDTLLERLQHAAALELNDFLTFDIRPDPRHHHLNGPGMVYQGRRFKAKAHLNQKPFGDPFGIDIGFADPICGDPQIRAGGEFLASFCEGVEPFHFRAYPLESHVAEKLHAYTIPRERENSRVRDLPDIALLASIRSIQAATLRKAIELTFTHRNTHPVPESLPNPPESWVGIYPRIAENNDLPWRGLAELLPKIRSFIDPILSNTMPPSIWDPISWSWSRM